MSIVYLNKWLQKKPKVCIPGCLLPPMEEAPEGFRPITITCDHMRRLFGRVAYTNWQEVEPGYVVAYVPRLGYVDLCMDTFVEN